MKHPRRLALTLGAVCIAAACAFPSLAQQSGPPNFGRTPGTPLGPSSDPVPGAPSTGMTPNGPMAVPGIAPTPGIGQAPGPGSFALPPPDSESGAGTGERARSGTDHPTEPGTGLGSGK
jgi:hypothetical protein